MVSRPEHPPLARSARADALAADAEAQLRAIAEAELPVDDATVRRLFETVDTFHRAVFEASDRLTVRCGRGCSNCCSQMVFDVHAFEVELIGRRLVEEGRAAAVRTRLEERLALYHRIRLEHPRRGEESLDDWIERIAIEFWKQDEPCALLDADGDCSVHDVRPWSCRRSFAASDPNLCRGETARSPHRRFFTLAPSEGFDEDLVALDRWARVDVDTDQLDHGLSRWLRATAHISRD